MDLASAERAVFATLLWHMRILAGWGPPLGSGPLRLLATGFEVANVTGQLARIGGQNTPSPYALGSMGTAWPAISEAQTAAEVRVALASSSWGDPGGEDLATVRLALLLGWARRVLDGVPGAADWAISGSALVLCRVLMADAFAALGTSARRDAHHLLGSGWQEASSPGELARHVPRAAAKVLEAASGPDDLWRAEALWWSNLEASGAALAARSTLDASSSVGVVGLLAVDAWRTRAALQIAARGGGDMVELFDAMA
ncbi:MAG: hypothetical protein P4L20_09430 [Acidimicrobiales bacterium]|nr:hypothetical protein [Acidimicrobiales bacterium]